MIRPAAVHRTARTSSHGWKVRWNTRNFIVGKTRKLLRMAENVSVHRGKNGSFSRFRLPASRSATVCLVLTQRSSSISSIMSSTKVRSSPPDSPSRRHPPLASRGPPTATSASPACCPFFSRNASSNYLVAVPPQKPEERSDSREPLQQHLLCTDVLTGGFHHSISVPPRRQQIMHAAPCRSSPGPQRAGDRRPQGTNLIGPLRVFAEQFAEKGHSPPDGSTERDGCRAITILSVGAIAGRRRA